MWSQGIPAIPRVSQALGSPFPGWAIWVWGLCARAGHPLGTTDLPLHPLLLSSRQGACAASFWARPTNEGQPKTCNKSEGQSSRSSADVERGLLVLACIKTHTITPTCQAVGDWHLLQLPKTRGRGRRGTKQGIKTSKCRWVHIQCSGESVLWPSLAGRR